MRTMRVAHLAGMLITVAALAGCGSSNGNGSPTSPSSPDQSGAAATITITSSGVSPQQVRIEAGQRVRFVNNDSIPREPSSNPHPEHTDCPSANVGVLAPGAARNTATFTAVRSCGFHDHITPEDPRFQGQILVGGAEPEPGPGY
jgi:plastocyanin